MTADFFSPHKMSTEKKEEEEGEKEEKTTLHLKNKCGRTNKQQA